MNQDWWVWTEWYEDRLRGADHPASRPLIEDLERDRNEALKQDWQTYDDPGWRNSAARINRLIAELEAKYRSKPPAQRQAAIEVWSDSRGKVHRRTGGVGEGIDGRNAEDLAAAWAVQAALLGGLEALDPGRNEPSLRRAMEAYRGALGNSFDDLNVIALGVFGLRLETYAANPGDILMDDAVNELRALVAAHALFVRRFPRWNDYIRDATAEPTDADVENGIHLARAAAEVQEIIDADVADPLDELADLAEGEGDAAAPAVRRELLRSLGNVLAGLLGSFVDFARDAGTAVRKGVLGGIEGGSEEITRNALSAIAFAGGTWALALAAGMPAEFGWLMPVLAFLKMKFKK
ncbi:MAG: hypothetical protein H6907_08665 [Hyphomicrobiales bacterium]|nr:hypothetical protein [Hyphomicrobiales bacterium]MCP5371790.1 hypothetical protein [Hyphomicrobiales bacterium]